MTLRPNRTGSLSHEELYLFDTTGFVKIPGFLTGKAIDACRQEVLALPSRRMEGRGDKERFDGLASRVPDFDELASSTAMRGCVEPLINQPFRLIESYALRRERDSVFYLHNGNSEFLTYGAERQVQRNMSFSHAFHNGKLYCMFVKVLIYLSEIRTTKDGPFCYLQGSHKANYPWFHDIRADEKPPLTKENFPSLEVLFVQPGDAIILNEALLHGTLPKTSEGDRIVLAFSYAPAFVADWNEIDIDSPDIHKIGHY